MFAFLRARSLREGFLRGRRAWTAVGVVVWGVRLIRRLAARRPQIVASERLESGQSITITASDR